MKKGDWVTTPRFLSVRINEVFDSKSLAYENGYREPTHYRDENWGILGKSIDINRMVFAAYRKEQ